MKIVNSRRGVRPGSAIPLWLKTISNQSNYPFVVYASQLRSGKIKLLEFIENLENKPRFKRRLVGQRLRLPNGCPLGNWRAFCLGPVRPPLHTEVFGHRFFLVRCEAR